MNGYFARSYYIEPNEQKDDESEQRAAVPVEDGGLNGAEVKSIEAVPSGINQIASSQPAADYGLYEEQLTQDEIRAAIALYKTTMAQKTEQGLRSEKQHLTQSEEQETAVHSSYFINETLPPYYRSQQSVPQSKFVSATASPAAAAVPSHVSHVAISTPAPFPSRKLTHPLTLSSLPSYPFITSLDVFTQLESLPPAPSPQPPTSKAVASVWATTMEEEENLSNYAWEMNEKEEAEEKEKNEESMRAIVLREVERLKKETVTNPLPIVDYIPGYHAPPEKTSIYCGQPNTSVKLDNLAIKVARDSAKNEQLTSIYTSIEPSSSPVRVSPMPTPPASQPLLLATPTQQLQQNIISPDSIDEDREMATFVPEFLPTPSQPWVGHAFCPVLAAQNSEYQLSNLNDAVFCIDLQAAQRTKS